MSGPQLIMWLETAMQEIGAQKTVDLDIVNMQHMEDPARAFKQMREHLSRLGHRNGRRR